MCGFIAQLVKHRTGIAEVTGSNPVEALIFFQASSFDLFKVHLTPKYICSWNKCLCYVKTVGANFFDLYDSSIFYVLLKSRNIWLKSAFIRDLGQVEL